MITTDYYVDRTYKDAPVQGHVVMVVEQDWGRDAMFPRELLRGPALDVVYESRADAWLVAAMLHGGITKEVKQRIEFIASCDTNTDTAEDPYNCVVF